MAKPLSQKMVQTIDSIFKPRQRRSPLYLYNLIPPERDVNYNLRRIHAFDQRVGQTNRYANTYFQNCPKECNQSDITLQSSQTISELKRQLIHQKDHQKDRFLTFTTWME